MSGLKTKIGLTRNIFLLTERVSFCTECLHNVCASCRIPMALGNFRAVIYIEAKPRIMYSM